MCASVDYTDKDGTFVVCEGNMTSVNGMLVYYDKAGKEYREVFEQANGGLEIGNVVQDMFMANGKIYLLTQNGDRMGGAGRFVVCDARTMRMEFADPLVFKPRRQRHMASASGRCKCNESLYSIFRFKYGKHFGHSRPDPR